MSIKTVAARLAAFAFAGFVALGVSFARAQDGDMPPPPQPPPTMQRLDDLESAVQHLTGQVEELQHENQVLQQKVDRLQRALEFQQNNQAQGGDSGVPMGGGDGTGEPASEPPARISHAPNATNGGPGLAPGPQNLGSLPQDTPMPLPKPREPGQTSQPQGPRVASLPPSAASGDAAADFDSAMALLRRAKYEEAQQAFRAFADAHPADAHAPDALFWTGDIAYSARHDYASAARAFAELLKKYAKAGRAPEGMLKLGLSLLALGQKQEGCATLAALPVKYGHAAPALLSRASAERKRAACS